MAFVADASSMSLGIDVPFGNCRASLQPDDFTTPIIDPPEPEMFFLADKAYRVRTVPPEMRTVRGAWPLLWLTAAAAFAAVALMWVAIPI